MERGTSIRVADNLVAGKRSAIGGENRVGKVSLGDLTSGA